VHLVKYQKGIGVSTCVCQYCPNMGVIWCFAVCWWVECTVGAFFSSHCLLLWGLSVWLEIPSISLSRAYTRCSAPFKAHFLHSFHGRAPVKAWISRMNPFSSTQVYQAKINFHMLRLALCMNVCLCMCDLKV